MLLCVDGESPSRELPGLPWEAMFVKASCVQAPALARGRPPPPSAMFLPLGVEPPGSRKGEVLERRVRPLLTGLGGFPELLGPREEPLGAACFVL